MRAWKRERCRAHRNCTTLCSPPSLSVALSFFRAAFAASAAASGDDVNIKHDNFRMLQEQSGGQQQEEKGVGVAAMLLLLLLLPNFSVKRFMAKMCVSFERTFPSLCAPPHLLCPSLSLCFASRCAHFTLIRRTSVASFVAVVAVAFIVVAGAFCKCCKSLRKTCRKNIFIRQQCSNPPLSFLPCPATVWEIKNTVNVRTDDDVAGRRMANFGGAPKMKQ